MAERKSEETITIKHVDDAEEKIDVDRVIETVKAQPKQSQIVLYAIIQLAEKEREIQTGEVFDKYNELCKQQALKGLTTRRVSDLISELDLFSVITTKIISKGRYGRTRVISLNVSDTVYNKLKNLMEEIFL